MLENMNDIQVATAIRDAVAPVFLLTGIGSILGVLVNRLGRAVDRARLLLGQNDECQKRSIEELKLIAYRTQWIRRAIALITISALCVCLSIASMFLVKMGINHPDLVSILFILSMSALTLGLLCFLREIMLASREIIAPLRYLRSSPRDRPD